MQDVDSNNQENAAEVPTFDHFRSITSSDDNAFILESLFHNDCLHLTISRDEELDIFEDELDLADDNYFIVREGDDLHYLSNLIGKSHRLKSLDLYHMPLTDSFRDGVAVNKSIQELYIYRDLGEEGFRCLAPFLPNTNTLKELKFSSVSISTESMTSISSILNQCQMQSLKRIYLNYVQLGDEGYAEFARALGRQPQLEVLSLTYLNFDEVPSPFHHGLIALGSTMKNWKSPCLKVLDLQSSHVNDDGMLALVEGMANCSNLERLNFRGNNTITEIGLGALSSLFQSKKCGLCAFDMSDMNITDDGMTAPGLASFKLLKKLDLSCNRIGDVGLKALAAAKPDFHHLEELELSSNAGFTAVGLKSLSSMLQTVSRLKDLNLSNNSIDDKGLQSFTIGMKDQCTIERLDLSHNAISSGVRSFAAAKMSSLCRLVLRNNNVGNNYEAMEALAEGIEGLRNLESLELSWATTSGLSALAPAFQSEKCSLQELDLYATNIEDSGAIALANGLRGNKSLAKVYFNGIHIITDVGWSAFERLLCDTSSVNSTYCSNHILREIGNRYHVDYPASIEALLDLNKQKDQGFNVPICKILMCHSDFDMAPLLRWKLKLLPFVVTWFERARSSQPSPTHSRTELKGRELSALYQFISGASQSVFEGYCSSSVSPASNSRKRKINQRD